MDRGPKRPSAGRRGAPRRSDFDRTRPPVPPPEAQSEVGALLREIDREPFDAYRRLIGRYALGEFWVTVDRVPPDPFAGAARVRVSIDRSKSSLPADWVVGDTARIAAEDQIVREAVSTLARQPSAPGGAPPGVGRVWVEATGAAVIERSTCRIGDKEIELRLWVDLPANGGWVRGLKAAELFEGPLVRLATSTLVFSSRRLAELRGAIDAATDHAWMQSELPRRGFVAFVADGSVLPRSSDEGDAPMGDRQAVPFVSPDERAVELTLPRGGTVRGMGIPAGVTVVTGGAFQGKSALAAAIAAGVRAHPPGDGRERVATHPDAVEIRGEPARPIQRADLSAFVRTLPTGMRGSDLTLDRASGALAQAATLVEAVESGAKLLILDEDHADAGWWVRDGRVGRLVAAAHDPLIAPVDRLRGLYEALGVSSIVVTRGAGDFLDVADTVLLVEDFKLRDATALAKQVSAATRAIRPSEPLPALRAPAERRPHVPAPPPASAPAVARGRQEIRMGEDLLDLRALPQIVEPGQARALALLLRLAAGVMNEGKSFAAVLDELEAMLERGLESLDAGHRLDLARPRRHEIAAVLNRWPALRIRRADP